VKESVKEGKEEKENNKKLFVVWIVNKQKSRFTIHIGRKNYIIKIPGRISIIYQDSFSYLLGQMIVTLKKKVKDKYLVIFCPPFSFEKPTTEKITYIRSRNSMS
jgi:hypothetical protein